MSSLCLPQWTRERKYGGADSQWVSIRHPAPRTLALNCANYYYYFLKWNLFVLFICISLMTNDFFLNLFMTVLGLRFCARAFSSCGKWGPFFIAVRGPLTIAASLVAGHRLQMRRLSSRGSQAQLLRGMWDLPRPGLEPVSPALAGGFSTTAPPGKPCANYFNSDL